MLLIFLSLLDVFNGLNLLIKNIQETTIRKLLGYRYVLLLLFMPFEILFSKYTFFPLRDWIYNPKSSKTKVSFRLFILVNPF